MGDASKQNARRLTRCRTGCMRCRIRRRKCDEGKPRCRNCVDRNFQCQYGAQLTFLTKNAQTVQLLEVESASASYEAIRFVNEDPEKGSQKPRGLPNETSPHEETLQLQYERADSAICQLTQRVDVELPLCSTNESSVDPVSQLNTTILSNNDESAVAGLLALGTSTNDTMGPDLGFPTFSLLTPSGEAPTTKATTPLQPPTLMMACSLGQSSQPSYHNSEASPSETIDLLRHYRYEVAPWLDICDLGQIFGIAVLQLARVSQPIWISVLALSKASINLQRPVQSHIRINKATETSATPDAHLDVTALALLRALDKGKNYITNVCSAWSRERSYDMELIGAVAPHSVGRDLNSAIYWLFMRLDLAAALATDTSIQVPLYPFLSYPRGEDIGADPYENVYCFAHRPLWLCARAVEFVHDENPSPRSPPLHTWMQLVEELERWYHERPLGFQPMIELEIADQTAESRQNFPLVLYANGGGVFANQIYHSAMLLLLYNRPRTARTSDFSSATMSPLWHAQRICSIALNNERRECWDPCLLASFLAASRCMTHELQQQEILRGFENIRKITGWDAGRLLEDLQAEWGLLET